MIIPYISGDLREVSASVLAYIGDSVYELYARCWVAEHSSAKSGQMHKMAIKYVSAKAQAKAIRILRDELSDTEENFFRRGKNSNPGSMAKNSSPAEYMYATGFEALIGYLFLDNQVERLEYLINKTFDIIDNPEKYGGDDGSEGI